MLSPCPPQALQLVLLLLPLVTACSPPFCPRLSNDPSLCRDNEYAAARPDSAWHVRIESSSRARTGVSGRCLVEETAAFTTEQEFLDVKIIDIVYSDVEELQVSAGDELRLDFGSWTEFECTGNLETDPTICFNSCGPVKSDIFSSFGFEEGKEYVLYANRLPWPVRSFDQDYELSEAASPSPASGGMASMSTTKDVCGQAAQFYVASGEQCDNNMIEPTASEIEQLKLSCGESAGEVPGSAEGPAVDSEVTTRAANVTGTVTPAISKGEHTGVLRPELLMLAAAALLM